MDQIEGFRMYMETAESGRLNIANAPEITTERFEALLPYAVALDVERPWANAFASALARAHPGDTDPMSHYHSRWRRGGSWSSDNFGRSVASAVASATSAATSSLPAQLVELVGIFRRLRRRRRRPRRRGVVAAVARSPRGEGLERRLATLRWTPLTQTLSHKGRGSGRALAAAEHGLDVTSSISSAFDRTSPARCRCPICF